MFKEIDSKMNLPKTEEEILKFWEENKIFEKSLANRDDAPLYSFYDGPPFATGTPHYGHIVASTMKDAVPRYWTMRGFKVPRKWGWDCHGLPIENIAEQALNIKHKKDIEELGVDKFNETCRSKVLGYVSEWEKVIKRLGRWADMKNSYKTMDSSYMESVWWTFKQLWDKGLIYEGYRSMHICPRCETTLSQSEVSEGYKNIKDISITSKFKVKGVDNLYILAWTTTPWTLIANAALAVGESIKYVKISLENNDELILAKERLSLVSESYKIVDEFFGKELSGTEYEPLFDFYHNDKKLQNRENGWKVYCAPFVTTDEGTGIVHIAPAFGEDDMNLGKDKNLPFVQHVGMDGIIKKEAGEFAGMNVKPADDVQKTDVEIIKYLANKELLFHKEKFEHSYPHCWRCDTPLLNYATSSWFVDISKIKNNAIKYAEEINWSPKHIKKGRFGKWLEGARDWSISRQRYWASVLPIWKCESPTGDCSEIAVFGSIAELENASGQKISDLHKHFVDKITFPCSKCGKSMRRVPDVLDTWFDSGSMPYAQIHYPFENKDNFEKSFPAEFIAEGADQTRAWFYYLHVISTAIMEKPAYKNVIVNGIVLAEDGKKMSKRLQNYPDPMEMFDKYGADVVRLYLLSSPVMLAENLNFKESELAEISRGFFRMLWNSYSFFTLYTNIDKWSPKGNKLNLDNLLDKWIISELNILVDEVTKSMNSYDLMKSSRLFMPFLDNLSNWYIRRSRKRFWKSENDSDKENAYAVLYETLVVLSKLLAPFTPFIADEIFKNLTQKESVHLEDFPISNRSLIDEELNDEMTRARKIVEMGLSKRAEAKIKVRQPLNELLYSGEEINEELEEIIAEEVNVKKVTNLPNKDDLMVSLDGNITEELKLEGVAREIIRNIQNLRKSSGFKVDDRITVFYETTSTLLNSAIEKLYDLIKKEVLANSIENKKTPNDGEEIFKIDDEEIWIGLRQL